MIARLFRCPATGAPFSLEILALFENGQLALAAFYMVASLLTCLLAVWAGATLMRLI